VGAVHPLTHPGYGPGEEGGRVNVSGRKWRKRQLVR